MKILNNQGTTLFRIGGKHRGATIIEKIPCRSRVSCQGTYENSEICGGFRCILDTNMYEQETVFGEGTCLF